jgi:hypothetical protein
MVSTFDILSRAAIDDSRTFRATRLNSVEKSTPTLPDIGQKISD